MRIRVLVTLFIMVLLFVSFVNAEDLPGAFDYFRYAEAYYALIEVEDVDSDIRFKYHHDDGEVSDGCWVYGEQAADTILSSLAWYHRKHNYGINSDSPALYARFLKLKIEQFPNNLLNASDTLAIIYSDHIGFGHNRILIIGSEFYDHEADTFYTEPVEVECGNFMLDKDQTVHYSICSTGKAILYIDYFKVADQVGISLIDDHLYDPQIIQSVKYAYYNGQIAGNYAFREPKYEQIRSWMFIYDLLHNTMIEIAEGQELLVKGE